ncbi:MAG: hypothetical protein Q8P41_14515 [Pseudomonadota bacterium]|nr:hypothetical protein [Pseudomonadota bacterium]
MLLALLALACSGGPRLPTFDCGKVICDASQICLHWTPADSAAPPDAGHGCVEAPEECGAIPTCECAGDVCTSDCDLDGGGVTCTGDEP